MSDEFAKQTLANDRTRRHQKLFGGLYQRDVRDAVERRCVREYDRSCDHPVQVQLQENFDLITNPKIIDATYDPTSHTRQFGSSFDGSTQSGSTQSGSTQSGSTQSGTTQSDTGQIRYTNSGLLALQQDISAN